MVYVPTYTTNSCVVHSSSGVIRVYDSQPQYNSDISYTEYFIHDDYYPAYGTQHFSNYTTLPSCIPSSNITDNVYYRVDFPSILLMFLIFSIFCFYIPLKIFSKIFKRGVL